MMPYYTRAYNPQPTTRVVSNDLKSEFQAVETGLASAETADGKAIRAPEATAALPSAASRSLKVLSFDASGNPVTTFAKADIDAQASAAAASAIAADSSADDAAASASASGASAVAAALSESAAAASAVAADASADAAAASVASIAGGPVASVNGMTGVVTIKSVGGVALNGTGDVPVVTRIPVWAAITATGTYTVPSGVTSIRGYAVGKGGDGGDYTGTSCNASGGGGGGMAYGDIAVTSGQTVNIAISAGVATLAIGGTTYLTANPGGNGTGNNSSTVSAGGTGGTASKHASVTNGGAYSGGAGGTTTSSSAASGGGSSGSPLGAGYAPNHQGGGAGWGGTSGTGATGAGGGGAGGAGDSYNAGGAGGAADSYGPGIGRSEFNRFTDLLLADCISPGSPTTYVNGSVALTGRFTAGPGGGGGGGGGHGGKGGGGGGCSGSSVYRKAGNGGFGGGGGGAAMLSSSSRGWGGNGGNGGGGGAAIGSDGNTPGTGGAAIVLIYA